MQSEKCLGLDRREKGEVVMDETGGDGNTSLLVLGSILIYHWRFPACSDATEVGHQ